MLGFPIIYVHKVVSKRERTMQKASKRANEKNGLLDQGLENCQLHSFPKISEDLDMHIDLFSVLVFQAWMKPRNGRILSVAPTDTNCLDDTKASFQFHWSKILAAVIEYKYVKERKSIAWLRKLIFACTSKATQIWKVVTALLKKTSSSHSRGKWL